MIGKQFVVNKKISRKYISIWINLWSEGQLFIYVYQCPTVCHMCADDRDRALKLLFLFRFTTLLYSLSLKYISIYTLWSANSSILCPSIQGLVTSRSDTGPLYSNREHRLLKADLQNLPTYWSDVCFKSIFWKTFTQNSI